MGSSNWPCISIILEANWFSSVSHLHNWAFANHLKMHVREREMTVLKKCIFHFILLVIHTTECYSADNERFFLTSLASQNTHYLQGVFAERHDSNKISLSNNRIWWNYSFAKFPTDLYLDFQRPLISFLAVLKQPKQNKLIDVKQNSHKWACA